MSRLTLSETIGLRTDLDQKLSGEDGHTWLAALKKFLLKQNPWEEVRVVNVPPSTPIPKLTFEQAEEKAYGMLGVEAEYAAFVVEFGNAQTPGKWTLAMVKSPKLTVANIIAVLRVAGSKADTWYSNPDTAVPHNARNCQEGSYAVDLEPGEDPDPALARKSQNDLKKLKKDKVAGSCITWPERWLLELVHFLMTGVNLDKNGIWTICAGSLDSFGVCHVSGLIMTAAGSMVTTAIRRAPMPMSARAPQFPKKSTRRLTRIREILNSRRQTPLQFHVRGVFLYKKCIIILAHTTGSTDYRFARNTIWELLV